MEKFEYIFIIVVYKNYTDLSNYLGEIKNFFSNYKVVIVNNYFSDEVDKKIETIGKTNDCDVLNIPNNGYGFGNNIGIKHAYMTYDFKNIIVCNADLKIEKFDDTIIKKNNDAVYGPRIKTLKGKAQNPYWAINNPFGEWLIYKGLKNNNNFTFYMGIIMNKLIRLTWIFFMNIFFIKKTKVFALHGSFVIFPKPVLDKIGSPYKDDMFLFAEEAFLAHRLKKYHVKSYVLSKCRIRHFEDGTMSTVKIDERLELKKSVVKYYEYLKK